MVQFLDGEQVGTTGLEEQLRKKLQKVEALYIGAGTVGERGAAGAALPIGAA